MGFRISVDTGGTFTDVVVADAKGIRAIGKALTTPKRIFEGMRAAIEVAAEGCGFTGDALLKQTDMLIYGTTRATNAVVTKSTAKTAFLTTRGFRDILVFKEGGKYDPHDYSYDYPQPYIPRRYTFEVDERIDAQGNVVRALDQEQARQVVRTLKERKFEAVAVSLMWSIANSAHEKALARLLDEELPGVPYTLSHELIPIVREYRRASTTAIDASLKPLMQQHLREMERDLRAAGFRGELLIGTSAGGCQHVSEVADAPGADAQVRARDGAGRRPGLRHDREPRRRRDRLRHRRHHLRRRPRARRQPRLHARQLGSAGAGSATWWRCRPSTCAASAPAAARSPGSMPAASCASVRRARAPYPGPPATAAAASSRR